ncbi:unnamed protein product [Cylicocyclus nassatus]|uniref:Uncharacterized protein n=1 Tax=Cylicocyclus nassatus TaxID=53992 RepID=A0AA36DM02_CYLNA|nr:unnamed protein product [Cylicocyclus nassatus]
MTTYGKCGYINQATSESLKLFKYGGVPQKQLGIDLFPYSVLVIAVPPFTVEITKGDERLCFHLDLVKSVDVQGEYDFRVEEFYVAPAAKEGEMSLLRFMQAAANISTLSCFSCHAHVGACVCLLCVSYLVGSMPRRSLVDDPSLFLSASFWFKRTGAYFSSIVSSMKAVCLSAVCELSTLGSMTQRSLVETLFIVPSELTMHAVFDIRIQVRLGFFLKVANVSKRRCAHLSSQMFHLRSHSVETKVITHFARKRSLLLNLRHLKVHHNVYLWDNTFLSINPLHLFNPLPPSLLD